MRVLLLGTGMQGRSALRHLAASDAVNAVSAADRDPAALNAVLGAGTYGSKVTPIRLDAADQESLHRLVAGGFDVVVDLLPVSCIGNVAEAAVAAGVHLVNTFYPTADLRRLAPRAAERGVALLPELGMDPGIDLVLLGEAVRRFDTVSEFLTYGAGIPEPQAAVPPLHYKISWSFEGVLRSYRRASVLVRNGARVQVPASDQFAPQFVHHVAVEEVGRLEAFPNEDISPYLDLLGLDPGTLTRAGRFTLRYPGHAALWRTLVDLHLLDDVPVVVDGVSVDRARYLAAALAPSLQYGADERDLAILRVEVAGTRLGRAERVIHEIVERRDLTTGLSAMSRLVGASASIGALMIVRGEIQGRGLLSPLRDVPADRFLRALEAEGIRVKTRAEAS